MAWPASLPAKSRQLRFPREKMPCAGEAKLAIAKNAMRRGNRPTWVPCQAIAQNTEKHRKSQFNTAKREHSRPTWHFYEYTSFFYTFWIKMAARKYPSFFRMYRISRSNVPQMKSPNVTTKGVCIEIEPRDISFYGISLCLPFPALCLPCLYLF